MIARQYVGGSPYLSKSIAAYMTAYWINQGKPLPDLVLPLSLPWYEKRRLGGNPHLPLAKDCSFYLERPCIQILRHRIIKTEDLQGSTRFNYRPTTLQSSCYERFKLKRSSQQSIEDQDVLLIALDRMDLKALIEAADSLQERHPKSVSALTFI